MILIWYFIFTNITTQDLLLIQHNNFTSAIQLIKQHEGYRSKPYYDTDSILTIGYGFRLNVRHGQFMSRLEAVAKIRTDLHYRLKRFRYLIKVPLNENQTNALLSFAYNVGLGNFTRSDLLRKLNKFNYNLESEFKRWIYANGEKQGGLLKRRNVEWKLFNNKRSYYGKRFKK